VRIGISKGRLAEMVEEATVDCYNESELVTGWFTMIEDNLAVPFETAVLGVQPQWSASTSVGTSRLWRSASEATNGKPYPSSTFL
jgi:hypothetical protein